MNDIRRGRPVPPETADILEGYEAREDQAFNSLVGPMYARRGENGDHRFLFHVAPHHLNKHGIVHGGMLTTFADMALGLAAHWECGERATSTVSLNCDFVAPGRLGDWIHCAPRVTRRTRAVIFVSGDLYTEERVLLTASGVWKILGAS